MIMREGADLEDEMKAEKIAVACLCNRNLGQRLDKFKKRAISRQSFVKHFFF